MNLTDKTMADILELLPYALIFLAITTVLSVALPIVYAVGSKGQWWRLPDGKPHALGRALMAGHVIVAIMLLLTLVGNTVAQDNLTALYWMVVFSLILYPALGVYKAAMIWYIVHRRDRRQHLAVVPERSTDGSATHTG